MNERIRELWAQAGGHYNSGNQYSWPEYTITDPEKFADLIRADERKRLEQAVEELAPVRDNPLLQNKPAAFWIENFKQIVRGDV